MNDNLQKSVIYPIAQWFLKENTLEMVQSIRKFDHLDGDVVENYTLDRLRKLVRHAYDTTAYYKALFDRHKISPNDIKTIDDFSKIPILTKDLLRDNFDLLISTSHFPKVSKVHSGGTMGQSIYVLKDNYSLSFDRAVKGKCIGWYDCSIGDREFRFWAYPFDKVNNAKAYLIDILLNRRRVSPIHMSEEQARKIARQMDKFQPKVIYGWTSGLYKFAQIALEKDIRFESSSIKVVISTAEKLYDYQRGVIEKVFEKPIVDEYGCSEAGVIAFQCENGKKHIQIENNYLEVVNTQEHTDGLGELVVTNLNNNKMPLIRYRIGDLGRLDDTQCSCGRRTPYLSHVSGRILDYLVDSKGEIVLGGVFCYICFDLIDKYKSIRDFRVRQDFDGTITIYYTASSGFSHEFLQTFERLIRRHVGDRLKIGFRERDDLSDLDAGKPRYVVSLDLRRRERSEEALVE
jgi:phenylacetate-CoA ligase